MATVGDLLVDAFSRVRDNVHHVVDGLSQQQLTAPVEEGANTIAWLTWHLTRVMDHHIADAEGSQQLWTKGGWAEKFGVDWDDEVTGYGQSADEVGSVQADAETITAYHDAVSQHASDYVATLSDNDLDRVVDERWDPPVTLAVRLVSVVNDTLQHVGQAAYAKGILERR